MLRLSRALALIAALALTAVVVGLAEASASPHAVAACAPRLTVLAKGQGSPDDLAWDGRKLLVSDINGGKVGVVAHGHVHTLVAHLREPEGIVPGPGNSLIVAEQATNRVVEIKLPHGPRTSLAKLPLPSHKMGIDSINPAGPGAIYIPDSARGRLYRLDLGSRKLTLLGKGMIRPVAAIRWGKAVVVADEYSDAVWRIGRTRTRLAAVPLPDDLAVISGHLITNSLVGQVWEVAPKLRLLSSAFEPPASDPQGLVADGPNAVILADESRNTVYRLSRLAGCL